jgi:S1-C subfamily serine protease
LRSTQSTNNGGGGGGRAGAAAKNAFIATTEVVVSTVDPNTQGARLGLKKGDVLLSYSGNALRSTQQVQDLVKRHANDANDIELTILRNNQTFTLDVQPGRLGVTMRVQQVILVR